jgi:hypothetical protein
VLNLKYAHDMEVANNDVIEGHIFVIWRIRNEVQGKCTCGVLISANAS